MQNLKIPYPKQLFILGNDLRLGKAVAEELDNIEPGGVHIQDFSDGESIPHQTETVRGRDVFIIFTSQNGPETGHWLTQYLRFIWCISVGRPHKITVIIPKLPHQRQDVMDRKNRKPKLTGLFPRLFQSIGVDQIVVCKLHNPASQSDDPPMEEIDTTMLIIDHIRSKYPDMSRLAIGAGDLGGSKYGRVVANEFNVPLIITDKVRDQKASDQTKVMQVYAQGIISEQIDSIEFVDDLISTFSTLKNAAEAVSEKYPHIKNFGATATHPDFGEETSKNIIESKFQSVCVTDTVPVSDDFIKTIESAGKKIIIMSVAKWIARTIDNLHNGESVSALWLDNGEKKVAQSN